MSAVSRRPPNAGKGRKKGVPNRATKNARDAIALLVEDNAQRLQAWLDEIARTDGPMAAWRCFMDCVEYHIPRLSRVEHAAALPRSAEDLSDDELLAIIAKQPDPTREETGT